MVKQMECIGASPTLQQVDRLKRFLTFIVLETAAGRGNQLKEYVGSQNPSMHIPMNKEAVRNAMPKRNIFDVSWGWLKASSIWLFSMPVRRPFGLI
jgi:hypothetical protein